MSALAIVALCFGGYAACSIAAGYVAALVGFDDRVDYSSLVSDRNTAILLGPFGLVFCLGVLASKAGKRRMELAAARHQAALAEAEAVEQEVRALLADSQPCKSGTRGGRR